MSIFEEDKPARKLAHEIGADISAVSVDELKLRIGLLRDEIARLEAEISSKSTSRTVAESLFKK